MPVRAQIGVKPTLGAYLYSKVQVLQAKHVAEHGTRLSEAALARASGMIPETFRRMTTPVPRERAATWKDVYITLDSAIRLLQIFNDPNIVDHLILPEGNADESIDADALIIAAFAPKLNIQQKQLTRKVIDYLKEHPDAGSAELIEILA